MQTDEQKIQELLKPRFKVIGPYPFSPYRVGDLVRSTKHDSFHITTTGYRNEFGDDVEQENFTQLSIIEEYPNLFRRLHWWEKRDENEMPRFLTNGEVVHLISEYDFNNNTIYITDQRYPHTLKSFIGHYQPATSADYNAYIEKQPNTLNQGV